VKKVMLNINFEESKVHFSLGCEYKLEAERYGVPGA
jgi:hypothetical protein